MRSCQFQPQFKCEHRIAERDAFDRIDELLAACLVLAPSLVRPHKNLWLVLCIAPLIGDVDMILVD